MCYLNNNNNRITDETNHNKLLIMRRMWSLLLFVRWEMSMWTECSHSCGAGMQSRSVRCIHEQGHGDGNKFVLPHELCPKPMPQEQQLCNAVDCPPYWATGSWSAVSCCWRLSHSQLIFYLFCIFDYWKRKSSVFDIAWLLLPSFKNGISKIHFGVFLQSK